MKVPLEGAERRRAILKDWGSTVLEIGKWLLILWLLWPIRNATVGPIDFTRVLLGILLFIIFAGKLLYDTIIMGVLKQRRTSAKQDFFALLGIVAGLSLVVGLMLVLVGFAIVQLVQASNAEGGE